MEYLHPEDREFRNKFDLGLIKISPESEERIGLIYWVDLLGRKYDNKFPFCLQKASTIIQSTHLFTFQNIGEIICSKVTGAAEYFFCITYLRMTDDSLYPSIEIITYNYSENGGIYCTDPYQMVPLIGFEDFFHFSNKQVDTTLSSGINPLFFRNFNSSFIEVTKVNGIIQVPYLQKYRDMDFEEQYRPFLTGKYPDDEIIAIPS